jgi:uncharacterized membrane protein YdbT with pleckstrin-like domain
MAAAGPAPASEVELWRGTPSQAENVPVAVRWMLATLAVVIAGAVLAGFHVDVRVVHVVRWAALAVAVLAIARCAGAWALTRSIRYRLTSQRLQIKTGILGTREEDVELRRVRDLSVLQPAMLRMFGAGHVVISGVDMSTPRVMLRAVREPERIRDMLRQAVDGELQRFGVRMVDYN